MPQERYTLQLKVVKVNEQGDILEYVETRVLDFACDNIEETNVVLEAMINHGHELGRSLRDTSPLRPPDRYHQGDGEDMLRRMEDAGGNRFATDLYGAGPDDYPDADELDYRRESDDAYANDAEGGA